MLRSILFTLLLVLSAWTMVSCRQSPENYVAKGNTFLDAGKYQDAILNYKKAIQKDAKFGEGYYRLGLAELKTDQVREEHRGDLALVHGPSVKERARPWNRARPCSFRTRVWPLSRAIAG